jgi:hypothetical protein
MHCPRRNHLPDHEVIVATWSHYENKWCGHQWGREPHLLEKKGSQKKKEKRRAKLKFLRWVTAPHFIRRIVQRD